MKKVYCHLRIIPVRIEPENPVLVQSGQLGAKIDYIDASVDNWISSGTIDAPLTSNNDPIVF